MLGIWIVREILIDKAMQSDNITQLKEGLQLGYSFNANAEGWAERKAMKKVISDYNKDNNYTSKENQYTIYKMDDNSFWITSEMLFGVEHNMEAGDCLLYIVEMLDGTQTEERSFFFIYVNAEQRLQVLQVVKKCRWAEDELDISAGIAKGVEVTIVEITIAQKTNFTERI